MPLSARRPGLRWLRSRFCAVSAAPAVSPVGGLRGPGASPCGPAGAQPRSHAPGRGTRPSPPFRSRACRSCRLPTPPVLPALYLASSSLLEVFAGSGQLGCPPLPGRLFRSSPREAAIDRCTWRLRTVPLPPVTSGLSCTQPRAQQVRGPRRGGGKDGLAAGNEPRQ